MLKKQTVWLLTMLSLIVVLSVYALTSPSETTNVTQNGSKTEEKAASGSEGKTKTVSSAENKLGQIQIDKAEERSRQQDKYEGVIASEKSSAEEVSAAYDDMQSLQTLAGRERILEDVIQSKGFKDVAVNTKGSQVQIFVNAEKLTTKQANDMIRLADEYLGTGKIISVSYALDKK